MQLRSLPCVPFLEGNLVLNGRYYETVNFFHFGSLMVSLPMQYWGRRKSLIALCVPFVAGFLLMGFTYFAQHKAMLYIGRIMTGLMNGAATPAAQIYVQLP